MPKSALTFRFWFTVTAVKWTAKRTGAPIILGRCPSLSAHESESMLRTYLVCRGKQERQANGTWEKHSLLTAAILLPQRLSCYWGKIVSLRMLTKLRLTDLRLTTAQQRSTGQNLPSDPYLVFSCYMKRLCKQQSSIAVQWQSQTWDSYGAVHEGNFFIVCDAV
jgi:hypothetical protein